MWQTKALSGSGSSSGKGVAPAAASALPPLRSSLPPRPRASSLPTGYPRSLTPGGLGGIPSSYEGEGDGDGRGLRPPI